MSEIGLVQIIEGALLAAGKPLTVAQLGELFEENERRLPRLQRAAMVADLSCRKWPVAFVSRFGRA